MRTMICVLALVLAASAISAEGVTVTQTATTMTVTITLDISAEKADAKAKADKIQAEEKDAAKKATAVAEVKQNYKTTTLGRALSLLSQTYRALISTDAKIDADKQAAIDSINAQAANLKASRVAVPDPE